MPDQRTKTSTALGRQPAPGRPAYCVPAARPLSALRLSRGAQELKGMRSLRRWGRQAWESLVEAQRLAVARCRRQAQQAFAAERRRGER